MRVKHILFLLYFLTLPRITLNAQKLLRVNYIKLGFAKKYDFGINDNMQYKLKGDGTLHTNKIMDYHDSVIVFDNYVTVAFNELRMIKIPQHSHHNKLFQKVFLIAAVGYPSLFAFNSWILGYQPILTEQAIILSVSFLTTSFIIKQLGITRVRLKKNGFIKVLDLDFEHLNTP